MCYYLLFVSICGFCQLITVHLYLQIKYWEDKEEETAETYDLELDELKTDFVDGNLTFLGNLCSK